MQHIYDLYRGFDEVTNALRALTTPISVEETKPKPGKACFAIYTNRLGKRRMVKAFWAPKRFFSADPDTESDAESIEVYDDQFYLAEGWYELVDNSCDFDYLPIISDVTHWMPMPLPEVE